MISSTTGRYARSVASNIHLCYAAPREALPIQFVCTFWPLFLAAALNWLVRAWEGLALPTWPRAPVPVEKTCWTPRMTLDGDRLLNLTELKVAPCITTFGLSRRQVLAFLDQTRRRFLGSRRHLPPVDRDLSHLRCALLT